MSKRTTETLQSEYICGQCTLEIPYLSKDKPPKVCPECGWEHLAVKKYSVPSEFKLDLTKY